MRLDHVQVSCPAGGEEVARAFYRDALSTAPDLPAAFAHAVAQIETRERTEGHAPSQPQAHFGPAIVTRLSELETLRVAQGTQR